MSADLYKVYVDPVLHTVSDAGIGARVGNIACAVPTCADDVIVASKDSSQAQVIVSTAGGFSQQRRYKIQPDKSVVMSCENDDGNGTLQLLGIVLDFSKAFDRVPHERLLRKLDHYGVRGSTLKWIRAFLTNRVQQVKVEGATSDSVQVLSGVPQGTDLGPLLVLVFINDLPDCVDSRIRLFADDCILYRCIKEKHDCELLQSDLNNLALWEKKWGMAFHPEKCSAIRVTRAKNPISSSYSLKGHTLQMEDSTRYLGVELQSNMSWNRHMDQAVKKANSTLGFLRRNLRISNEQTKLSAYFSMVRPIVEYCSTVWNPYTREYTKKVEMVQRRAARYVTNRYHNTSSVTSMLDHLEWESLEARRAKNQLTMFFKIIHGLVDIPANDYLVPASTRTRSQHSLKFLQIPVSSEYYKSSFFPRTVCRWNSLPANVAEAPSLVSFKQELSSLSI